MKKTEKSLPDHSTSFSFSYFSEVKEEIRKISWTEKTELIFFVKASLISIFVFGLSIYLVDLSIKSVLEFLEYLVRILFS
ncbi:MAG: preprotein translocase subunit SecE [Rhabdochlamydiaceae bacterium]